MAPSKLLYVNLRMQFWYPNQDQLLSLKVAYRIKNPTLNVLLRHLGLRRVMKSVH